MWRSTAFQITNYADSDLTCTLLQVQRHPCTATWARKTAPSGSSPILDPDLCTAAALTLGKAIGDSVFDLKLVSGGCLLLYLKISSNRIIFPGTMGSGTNFGNADARLVCNSEPVPTQLTPKPTSS